MHLEYEYIIDYILKYILSLKLNQLLFSEKSIIVRNAQKGDVIVLAGKGHEDYQEIQGVRYPMDERTLVSDAVKALKEEGVEGLI